MRRLLWIVILFAVAWSGWWLFAARTLNIGLTGWFDQRRSEGWVADVSDVSVTGYPLFLEATLLQPVLADPQTGVAFEASELDLAAAAWWPGRVDVRFPDEDMIFASPNRRHFLRTENALAKLRLRPGTQLEVQEAGVTSDAWSLSAPEGSLMSAMGLSLRLSQSETQRELYDIAFDAPAFQPGDLMRRAFLIPADWPVAFDALTLDMSIAFDRPINRRTLEIARPQPRKIDLRLAEAVWGKLLLRTAASLEVTAGGVLSGEVSLQARNWRTLLTLAESTGVLPSAMRPQVENVIAALARSGGNPDAIDVALTLRDGTIYFGFIPLGPAPLLVLR